MTTFQFITICVLLITGICSVFYCTSQIKETLIECVDKIFEILEWGGLEEDYDPHLDQPSGEHWNLDTGCDDKDGRKYE